MRTTTRLATRWPSLLLALLALSAPVGQAACSTDDPDESLADASAAAVADAAPADGGPCDAAPSYGCLKGCLDGETCVVYLSESGWSSCTTYYACVATELDCPSDTCNAECEAVLCPDPYSCVPKLEGQLFTCSKP